MANSLQPFLMDKGLSEFGDVLVNFIYSLAKSKVKNRLCGGRVSNNVLSKAISKSGVRSYLPHRLDVHDKGNAAEALIAYAWLNGYISINDAVNLLSTHIKIDDLSSEVEAFTLLLKLILRRMGKSEV
ncbi:MAG: hypothetical protein NDF53_02770 [archaeon GB-1867-097]|nr:hypothetical protein [Candidatus Verstraetearchaeota archaeon]MCS7374109.1 hypothetical protein [Candidatus Culexmicrobium thermophilum]MCS7384637.1 hypothetical protein [Candidatus Culexmicrobium thermophilum]RLE56173.1 MAG: hypothetical protein DRJ30_02805 [Candidatus Verstraetearchaeota archaeon]HDO19938.1 hypothetical protein [Candidatus Bathyarchaeota archaeon]